MKEVEGGKGSGGGDLRAYAEISDFEMEKGVGVGTTSLCKSKAVNDCFIFL